MPYPPLDEFVAQYSEDIAFADELVRAYVHPDSPDAPLISTVIDWYRDLDVEALRDRARILERLAPPNGDSIYDLILAGPEFKDARDDWTGKGGDAFFRYCMGGTEAEKSVHGYLELVENAVRAHFTALEGVGDGNSGVVVLLQKAQYDFNVKVREKFANFRDTIDKNYDVPTSIDPPQFAIDVIVNVYKAGIKDAETIGSASDAVRAEALAMSDGHLIDLNEGMLGPVETSSLDGSGPVEGGWRPK